MAREHRGRIAQLKEVALAAQLCQNDPVRFPQMQPCPPLEGPRHFHHHRLGSRILVLQLSEWPSAFRCVSPCVIRRESIHSVS